MVFTAKEFASFTQQVVDCFCVAIHPAELGEVEFS